MIRQRLVTLGTVLGLGTAGLLLAPAQTGASGASPAAVPTVTARIAPVAARRPPTLRVASYNVRTVAADPVGAERPWRVRRNYVARDILAARADVVGVQEASQNPRYRSRLISGWSQYIDLRDALNRHGARYRLTNAAEETSRDCRILYNNRTVKKLSAGAYRYRAQSSGANDTRYVVWAVFKKRSNGKRFLFVNTHLATRSATLQKKQWVELIGQVNRLRHRLPVVVVGDFQRSKFKDPAATMMQRMKANGYGDVVGQQPRTARLDRPRAHRLVRAWVNSMNGFDRDVRDYAIEDQRRLVAANNDWIFASNRLRVRRWQVTVHMDPRTLRLTGVIPSDHNMVSAALAL